MQGRSSISRLIFPTERKPLRIVLRWTCSVLHERTGLIVKTPISDSRTRSEKLLIFEKHPYQRDLDTEIVETGQDRDRPFAVLEDTVCYPEGGGQPGDRGWLENVQVEDTQKRDGRILHYLSGPVVAGPAHLKLDWTRRFDHMQQHSAQHLLTALAADRCGWQTCAFHLGKHRCDIDLDCPNLAPAQLTELEDQAAAEIRAARPIRVRRVTLAEYEGMDVRSRGLPADHEGSVRIVEIEGVDLNTCGGTHLSSTSEIEVISLLGSETVGSGIRLFFVAGGRARRRLAEHETRNRKLRSLLGAADRQIRSALEQKLEQCRQLGQQVRGLEQELAVMVAERLLEEAEELIAHHFEVQSISFLQLLGRRLSRRAGGRLAFLTASAEPGSREGCFLLAAGADFAGDLPELGRIAGGILEGRGGGSGSLFQGKARKMNLHARAAQALREELE